ncbi:MAG: WD40 repeat domain-containing protein [Egibacteraceae bacterium]
MTCPEGAVVGVAFSGDGRRVASGGGDGTVRVWDAGGVGDPVVLSGHEGFVGGVAFSGDGARVASGGADGTVRVWDAGGPGDPVVLSGHEGAILGVAFSGDGRRVASGGADGTVRIWHCEVCGSIEEVLELAEQRSTRPLTCQEREIYLHEPPCPP